MRKTSLLSAWWHFTALSVLMQMLMCCLFQSCKIHSNECANRKWVSGTVGCSSRLLDVFLPGHCPPVPDLSFLSLMENKDGSVQAGTDQDTLGFLLCSIILWLCKACPTYSPWRWGRTSRCSEVCWLRQCPTNPGRCKSPADQLHSLT